MRVDPTGCQPESHSHKARRENRDAFTSTGAAFDDEDVIILVIIDESLVEAESISSVNRRGNGLDAAVSVNIAIWRRNLRCVSSINSVYADWFTIVSLFVCFSVLFDVGSSIMAEILVNRFITLLNVDGLFNIGSSLCATRSSLMSSS
jgi:hypothetical protein